MLEKIINSKFVINNVRKVAENPASAAKFLIGGVVAKDAFEYAVSTVQSLKNEEIPKKKRKLMALLDSTTGVLSCVSQLALGFGILNKNVQKRMGDFLFKDLIKAGEHTAVKTGRAGLAVASSLLLTNILVKRILVPLIAAPIASYGNNRLSKQQKCEK